MSKVGTSATGNFQSRDEQKKKKELDEQRKLGLVAAEKDEEGKDINPHIPQYISKAPWYLTQGVQPSLKHQRFKPEEKEDVYRWYKRGLQGSHLEDEDDTTFRVQLRHRRKKGCENCGSLTHTKKNCVERPRVRGAKYTGKDICKDEYLVEDLGLGYDGKRDRWAGFDSTAYESVIKDYEAIDIKRKMNKANELQALLKQAHGRRKKQKIKHKIERLTSSKENGIVVVGEDDEGTDTAETETDSGGSDSESDIENEDAKLGDFDVTSAPMGSKDDRTRTTTRNLRIREDTAKYLYNLDVDSAFYDPKTRSMRDNPLKHLKPEEQPVFKGDNFPRNKGDAIGVKKMEVFAWEAYTHGSNVHFNALPTQLEKLHKEYLGKKEELIDEKKNALLKKYGGTEHLNPPVELIYGQTEVSQEYNKDGSVVKRGERMMVKSKYEEDSYAYDHTSVWGSFYNMNTKRWGYACCNQEEMECYCTTSWTRVGQ